MPEPAPEAPIQILLAPRVLLRIHIGATLHLARRRHQPGFAAIGFLAIAAPAFVVVEVLAESIIFVHAIDAGGLVHVPADEVDGVIEFLAVGPVSAGAFLIVGPDLVLGLGVARRRRHQAPRDNPEQVFTRCLGVVTIAGLLVHDRERHLDRHAPTLLRDLGGVVPVALFPEDLADIVGRAWRRCTATGQ